MHNSRGKREGNDADFCTHFCTCASSTKNKIHFCSFLQNFIFWAFFSRCFQALFVPYLSWVSSWRVKKWFSLFCCNFNSCIDVAWATWGRKSTHPHKLYSTVRNIAFVSTLPSQYTLPVAQRGHFEEWNDGLISTSIQFLPSAKRLPKELPISANCRGGFCDVLPYPLKIGLLPSNSFPTLLICFIQVTSTSPVCLS